MPFRSHLGEILDEPPALVQAPVQPQLPALPQGDLLKKLLIIALVAAAVYLLLKWLNRPKGHPTTE